MRNHGTNPPMVSKRELILELRRQVAYATAANSRELTANARAFELAQENERLRKRVADLEAASRERKNAISVAASRMDRRLARMGRLRADMVGTAGT